MAIPLDNGAADKRFTVSVSRCSSYEPVVVERAVSESVKALGGIERFVKSGETILVKPNMLSARAPEDAVTTHPEIVRAVIRMVKAAGATPIVGDSPSGLSTDGILDKLAERTGIARVCEEEKVEFAHFTESKNVRFERGVVAKSFELTAVLDRVDGIISVAKMKTHTLTGITGAVKNLFGLIPGLKKAEYHFRMMDKEAFSAMLVDLAECVHPRLTVMDAVLGMDGDGPSGGTKKGIGLVIASDDVHALDAFFLHFVGAEVSSVPTVRIARERGLGPRDTDDVRIVGDGRAALRLDGFKMPSTAQQYGRMPKVLGRLAGEAVTRKPVFSATRCTMCGACIEVCPARVLRKDTRRPVIDRTGCIRCYCCGEVCPTNAVLLKRQPLRSIGRAVLWTVAKRRQPLR
jgi:uncharacterized protein (DUF362 family)/NAD-dependent dihydropyrimidine dehydrogenase PreA subunit